MNDTIKVLKLPEYSLIKYKCINSRLPGDVIVNRQKCSKRLVSLILGPKTNSIY